MSLDNEVEDHCHGYNNMFFKLKYMNFPVLSNILLVTRCSNPGIRDPVNSGISKVKQGLGINMKNTQFYNNNVVYGSFFHYLLNFIETKLN